MMPRWCQIDILGGTPLRLGAKSAPPSGTTTDLAESGNLGYCHLLLVANADSALQHDVCCPDGHLSMASRRPDAASWDNIRSRIL